MAINTLPNTHILSPIDHTFPGVNTCYYLYFQCICHGDVQLTLQRGVERLVQRYPFLTGEIVESEGPEVARCNGLRHVQESVSLGKRYSLIEFRQDLSLSVQAITEATARTGPEDLLLARKLSPLPLLPEAFRRKCLVRFRATTVSDGLVLAMGFSHSFFDANGAAHLLKRLAELCGDDSSEPWNDPDDQSLRRAIWGLGDGAASSKKHAEHFGPLPAIKQPPGGQGSLLETLTVDTMVCRWKVPAAKVEMVKKACVRLLSSQGTDARIQYLSSLDVLTSCLSTCLQRSKAIPGPSKAGISINLRERLNPTWPMGYLGNLATFATVLSGIVPTQQEQIAARQITYELPRLSSLSPDLAQVYRNACSLRETISSFDDQFIRGLVSWLVSEPDLTKVNIQPYAVNFTSWRHLNLYDLDFGPSLRRPRHVLTHGMPPTLCLVMPENKLASDGRNDWDVVCYFSKEDYLRLVEDDLVRFLLE
ncbi:hypothetical protein BDV19DRAFT_385407 [Aspergillus venezuelensis]